MPITLAHPAAILPLGRLGLPMAVLIAGSMVPDIPLFMGWLRGYQVTHSLLGVLVIDVALAIGVVVLWYVVVRDALADMAPPQIRSRLAERARPTSREWLLAPVAACLGATTHVLWDAFTHPARWGPRHIEWLRIEHAGLSGLKWVQYVSGIVGLAIVAWALVNHLRSLEPLARTRPPPALPLTVLPTVVVISVLVGLASSAVMARKGLHAMAFFGVVNGLIAVAALGMLACAAWHVARYFRTCSAGSMR
ncbi:MAG: DUF4184 family protein [Nocardioides sp.]